MGGHPKNVEKVKNAYRVLVKKPHWKIPLGRSNCRWENNIKINVH
jgi:hypothetical protein